MEKQELHLWFAYPDDLLEDRAAGACMRLLSEDEQARLQAFKFERHRREYLATHALARTALSYQSALPPQAWRFQLNAYGKPAVDPECGLRFNLSNSPGLVACLIGDRAEVGVDLEPWARANSIAEVAPRMFSTPELVQLEALCEDQRPERCLRLWTLKEAYSKARGMGMALQLNRVSFLFQGSEQIRMDLDSNLEDASERWRFCQLNHADHCISMIVEGSAAPELHVWEARPPSAAPQPQTHAGELWLPAQCADEL